MKKIILIFLAIILIIVGLAYLNRALLSDKIKTEIIKALEERLERKFELQEIKINPLKGILIENLVIYDNPKYSQEPLLNIKKASIDIPWLSILLQRKFIITSINIDKAEIRIIRLDKNSWNFSDFIKQKSQGVRKKPLINIYKATVSNTKVLFEDRTITPPFRESIEDLNVKLALFLSAEVKFNLEAKINNKELPASIYSNGKYNIPNKSLSAHVKIQDALLNKYSAYLKTKDLQLQKIKLQNSEFDLIFENKKLEISAKADIRDLDLRHKKIEFLANLNLSVNLTYDPSKKDRLLFSANAKINDGYLKEIPSLGSFKDIAGDIFFEKNKVQTKNLTAQLNSCPVVFSGSLENFKNPIIEINVDSDIKLSEITTIIPAKFKSSFSEIDGNAKLKMNLSGYLKDKKTLIYTGSVKISDTFLKLNFLPEKLLNIKGDIDFNKDSVAWENLSFLYKEIAATVNGSLNNFASPTIVTTLKSDSFDLDTEINISKNIMTISELKGSYLKSYFDIKGDLDTTETVNPLLALRINSIIELEDLKNVLPEFEEQFKKANLKGVFSLEINVNGKLQEWKDWQLQLKANSESFSLFGFNLNTTQIQFMQAQNVIEDLNIKSTAYDSQITINAGINLSNDLPYRLNINIPKLDLSKLKMDTPLKEKPISGIFNTQMKINGHALKPHLISGEGSIEIKDGNLWELDLLKGLGQFLSIPDFNKITFNAANGNFTIKNKAIHTNNLKLVSEELLLACEGSVDFDKNIDLLVATQFSEGLIENSADLKNIIASAIVDQAGKIISVKLSGKIQKPKYSIVFKPVDYFKGVLESFGLDIF